MKKISGKKPLVLNPHIPGPVSNMVQRYESILTFLGELEVTVHPNGRLYEDY